MAGVCAGIAQYFLVNPLLIRLGFLALVLLPNLFRHRFPFPGVGLFDRDFDLPGLVVVVYVILWIALPKREDAPTPIDTLNLGGALTGRKLFRDVDTGKVGGVAAGLAAYFRTDVVLVRVLFLLSAFLTFGTTIIVYIILWVVVPEALTVSEKMQMRGDAVTLSGIDNNLRSNAFDGESPTPAGSRSVGTFLEGAARSARPAASFLGTAIRWVVGALLIFWGGSWLFGVLTALGAALSIIPFTAVERTSNGFMFDDTFGSVVRNLPPWGAVAGALFTGIPALALILLGLRLILRRAVLSRTVGQSLLGLWLLGTAGSAAAGLQVARNFQTKATYTTTVRLNPVAGRGIVLDSRPVEDHYEWVNLHVAPADSGRAPYVEEEFRASGRTQDAARLTAQQSMLYNITQRDSTILFDQGLQLRENAPFRNQKLTLTLYLPLDKVYRLTPLFVEHLDDDDFVGGHRPNDHERAYRARFTREGKFTCLDCPRNSDDNDNGNGNSSDSDNDGDRDGDEVVNLGVNGTKMQVRVNTDGDDPKISIHTEAAKFNANPDHYGTGRKTLNTPGNFTEIEAHGGYQVLVRQGESYRVEAAGRPEDMDEVRLSTDGDRLLIQPRSRSFFGGFRSGGGHAVLVTVTLPRLQRLELSGACQADVSGFRDEKLRLEASGACVAFLSVNVPRLELDLSSASQATLRGTANELAIEGSSASQVEALALRADRATLDLSGASSAKVRASEELKVDLRGASTVNYAGRPGRIEKDLAGASSLEEVKE